MSIRFGKHAAALIDLGFRAIPVKGKAPFHKDWRKGITADQVRGFGQNLNIGILATSHPAVDIDVRDQVCAAAIESWALMEIGSAPVRFGSKPKRLLAYRTEQPFTKIKVFLKGPMGLKDSAGKDFAIEFLGDGQQWVAYGEHSDGHDYEWQDSEGLLELGSEGLTCIDRDSVMEALKILPGYLPIGWSVVNQSATVESAGDALALYKAPLVGWDIDKVQEEVLSRLDPDCSHDEWNLIGMALHHQGQGDDEWLELWDKWSESGESWQKGLCQAKWNSYNQQLSKGQGAVTLASLIKKASGVKAIERKQRFDELKQLVDATEDAEDLRANVCAEIQKDSTIDKFHRDVLASLLKSKFKELGMPAGIGEIKKLIKPKAMEGLPAWLDDWVYVTHSDIFFNLSTKRKAKPQGFNAMYNREVGAGSEPGSSASAIALDLFKIPTPDKIMYLPWAGEMFDMNGLPCVNSYNVNSVPDIPAELTKSDVEAIELIKKHLHMILLEPGAVEVLIHWMAHNVQKPGKKIRWAPLIKGIEGDGKSLIGKIVSAAIGHANIGEVSPDVIGSSFSAWAEGRCVNILEEIRQVGHNRHDLANKLKTYITNDTVEVHRKGENAYQVPNVTNYIAFTNYQDALPLEETDRRWWIQFTPFSSRDELQDITGPNYFNSLHNAIENHQPAIRRWLLEVDIPETFEPNGTAPASAAKNKMIAMGVSDEESAAREIIEQGCFGVSKTVVSTSHLMTALSMVEGIEPPHGPAVARLMSKLGFSRVPKPIRWQNATIRVWTKSYALSRLSDKELNAEVRKLLDSTMVLEKDDILS